MNYLQVTLYRNTLQDWLISLAIVFLSLLIARHIYRTTRTTVCEWLCEAQGLLEKTILARVFALIACLIPLVGFALAHNRLFVDAELANWLNMGLVIAGQVVFLLTLVTLLDAVLEELPIKYLGEAKPHGGKHLLAQMEAIEKASKRVRVLGRALLTMVPVLTVLAYMDKIPATTWAIPIVIIAMMTICCTRIIRIAKRKFAQPTVTKIKFGTALDAAPPVIVNDPDRKIKNAIVQLFLDIFKHQLGAAKEAPAEFHLVDSRSFAPNYIYELRTRMNDDWQSRRMTIGPLGTDTTSRSRCFYVIYDYHLVIKIPPTPIKDLNEYMKIIKRERSIVNELSMKECIIPSVSVILKMLQRLSNGASAPQEGMEENYVKWLHVFPEFQEYLKIGDTFVFFMDLSKYYFLHTIIESFHTVKKSLYDEIYLDAEIAWDSLAFEEKYGSGSGSIFLSVEKVYSRYEFLVKELIERHEISTSLSLYQLKEWFFIHLAGERITETGKKLSPEFLATLNTLTERTLNENPRAIHAYRKIVKEHINKSRFIQNKASMEGIIANLLELLAYLRQKSVVMRDLKPDNLLVAGDRERYPLFLANHEEYKIGLIDVETAVITPRSGHTTMAQPLLGGTPQYATPSHLFSNQLLTQVHEDLSLILHFQDWYAVIAMIYKTVSGVNLFETTANLFPQIVTAINETNKQGNELSSMMTSVNQIFWNTAAKEFTVKMAEKRDTLKSLDIFVADAPRRLLTDFVRQDRQRIAQRIEQCVNYSDIALSAKDRKYMLSCSHRKACQLRKNFERKSQARMAASLDAQKIRVLLEKLESLKSELELKTELLELLGQSELKIAAYDLLEIMFAIVRTNMYAEKWRVSEVDGSGDFVNSKTVSSSQPTMEATIEWPTITAS